MNSIIKRKIKIAKKTANILSIVPHIKMIALSGSVANLSAKNESDIDIFIVTRKNFIFSVRYLCVFLITIFGLKCNPKKNEFADKISLSFFLNENNLNMDRLSKNSKEENLRAKWIYEIIPMYDEHLTYLDFMDKNSWVKKYYKNYYTYMTIKTKNIKLNYILYFFKKIFELISFVGVGYIFEKIVRHIQIQRLFNFKHKYFGHEKMIINDQIIKLHCTSEDKELF